MPLPRLRPRIQLASRAAITAVAVAAACASAKAQSPDRVASANQQTYFGAAPMAQRGLDGDNPAAMGKTGFDSKNLRGKKLKRPRRITGNATLDTAPPPPDPTAPATYLRPQPRVAGTEATPVPPGQIVYADGTVAQPAPGSVARVVQARRVPPPAAEPFDPLGLRLGTFIAKPAVEFTGGYDSNPARTPRGKGSTLTMVAPELVLKSDWERHEFTADLRGSYVAYQDMPSFNKPDLNTKATARIDVSSHTKVDLEGRYLITAESPSDPNFPTGVAEPPIYTTTGFTGGVTQRFNRVEVSLKGKYERIHYDESTLNDGSILDNTDLNYRQYGTALRGSYEVMPGIKPFVEFATDKRDHDQEIDNSGTRRNSYGTTPRIGTTFELSRILTGEISAGYLTRRYDDPNLQELQGLVFDAALTWTASALTKATLTAKSSADESRSAGVSGILRRDIGIQVEHAFRQWLILTAKANAGVDDFQGSDREDTRYGVSAGLVYKAGRNVQLKGEARQEWFRSNVPDSDYMATTFLFGLRFQN